MPTEMAERCTTCHRRDHFRGTWQGHDFTSAKPIDEALAEIGRAAEDLNARLARCSFPARHGHPYNDGSPVSCTNESHHIHLDAGHEQLHAELVAGGIAKPEGPFPCC